eukprot:4799381-Pleurochrysis_carterae.AAC.1
MSAAVQDLRGVYLAAFVARKASARMHAIAAARVHAPHVCTRASAQSSVKRCSGMVMTRAATVLGWHAPPPLPLPLRALVSASRIPLTGCLPRRI